MNKLALAFIGATASLAANAQSASDTFLAQTSVTTTVIAVGAPIALLATAIAVSEDNDTPSGPVSTTTSTAR